MSVTLTRRSAGSAPAVAALTGCAVAALIGCAVAARPALAAPVPTPAATERFGWPLDGSPSVVRRFEPPPRPWLAGHRGVDLAAGPGTPVRAAGPGTVRFAGRLAGRGVVSIDHADGLRTTYEPVTPGVVTGQAVRAGDPIGVLDAGHPGCPVLACLHWGLRRGEVYLDPLALVGRARVRLLPLAG
jgi:murein DD-endopeptidase MepM/ murein hydrolase activator NlpD